MVVIKGVVLAGGTGSRLGDLSLVTNKHLLPVGYQPMIYYPLKKLISSGIQDILLITGTEHVGSFIELLGSGSRLGCDLTYRVQEKAGGIAQALGLARNFCKDCYSVVLLGDNIFQDELKIFSTASICLKEVENPQRFGVAEFKGSKLIKIYEKPNISPSKYVVTGIYGYPPDVFDVISELKPSPRGELEITDVNNYYIEREEMTYWMINGYWSDAGTPKSLMEASQMVV